MKRFLILLALAVPLWAANDSVEQAVRRCLQSTLHNALLFPPVWGRDPYEDSRFPGSQLLIISRGHSANILRVVPATDSSRLLKVFPDKTYHFANEPELRVKRLGVDLRDSHFEALQYFGKLPERGVDLGFVIPKVSKLDLPSQEQHTPPNPIAGIQFEKDVLGRDVKSIVMDESLPLDLRQRVRRVYAEKLALFEAAWLTHCEGQKEENSDLLAAVEARRLELPFLVGRYTRRYPQGGSHSGLSLLVHPEQVIVDARDFTFYLVDTE